MQGVVKIYDPVTGAGVVVRDDDRSEVFLQPGSLKGVHLSNASPGTAHRLRNRPRRRSAICPVGPHRLRRLLIEAFPGERGLPPLGIVERATSLAGDPPLPLHRP